MFLNLKKVFSLALCLSLGWSLVTSAQGAPGTKNLDGTKPALQVQVPTPSVVRELNQKRTATSRHFLLSDGTVRAEITGAANSWQDENGQWHAINPQFVSRAGAFSSRGSELTVRPVTEGLWFFDAEGEETQVFASGLEFRQGASVTSFQGSWIAQGKAQLGRGTEMTERLEIKNNLIQRDILMETAPQGSGDVVVSTELTLPEGWSLFWDRPDVIDDMAPAFPAILDERGRTRFSMLPPLARDATATEQPLPGQPNLGFLQGNTQVIALDNNRFRIEVTFAESWLKSSDRQYPVSLDPTFSGVGNWGGFIYYNSGTAAWSVFQGTPYSWIYLSGNYASSGSASGGYMQFDLSSIAPNSAITSAKINPYVVGANASADLWAYDAAGQAPFAVANASADFADFRGGSIFGYWWVSSGASGLEGESGGLTFQHNLQMRVPDGFIVVGFASDVANSTYRQLDSGLTQLNVTYDPGPLNQLAITEVNTGAQDWVEIYNYGPDLDIGGMVIETNDGSFKTTTLPSFILERHTFVRVIEGAGTNSTTELYHGFNWGWSAGSNGEVGLKASGYGVDYVKFGSPGVVGVEVNQQWQSVGMSNASSDVIRRIHDADTDQPEDWTGGGTPTPGAMNDGLLGNRRRSHLVINELSTSPDAIEIINLAPVYQRTGGWQLDTYTNGNLDGAGYTFPNGFYIPAGGRVRVSENGSKANDSLAEVFTEYNIGWTTGTQGEAILYRTGVSLNDGGDYVAFNNPQILHWQDGTNWHGTDLLPDGSTGWYRADHMDTDSAYDFFGTSSFSWGNLNPNQLDPALVESNEMGTSSTGWTTTNSSYGNRFLATSDTILWGFKQELTLNETQDVTMYVFEDSGAGFNIIWQDTQTNLPASGRIMSSGTINLPLVSGNSYVFLTLGTGNATLTRVLNTGLTQEYVAFGDYLGRTYSTGGIGTLIHLDTAWVPHQWIETTNVSSFPPVDIITTSLPDGTDSVAYSQYLLGSGGAGGLTWSHTVGTLPTGLTMAANGILSGTPNDEGWFTFTLTLADNFGNSDSRVYTMYIVGPNDVRMLTSWLPDGLVGRQYPDMNLQAQGGDSNYYWWVNPGPLPPGLTLQTDGTLSGTPTAAGDYQFSLRVEDGASNPSGPKVFNVTIREIPNQNGWVRRGLNGGDLDLLAVSPNLDTDGVMFVAGPGPDLYFSDNRGNSWASLPFSLLSPVDAWLDLVLSPTYDGNASDGTPEKTLFAIVQSGPVSVLIRSTNGGVSWTDITMDGTDDIQHIKVSPNYANDSTLVAHVTSGRYVGFISVNQGTDWGALNSSNLLDVEFSPDFANDQAMYAVSNKTDGVIMSTNLGADWTPINLMNNVSSNDLVLSPNFANDHTMWVFGTKIWRSTDGGFNIHTLYDAGLGIKNMVLQPLYDETDPANRTMFAVMEESDGITWRLYRSPDGGLSWTPLSNQAPSGHPTFDESSGTFAFNTVVDPPIVVSPQWGSDDSLFHVGKGFWMSSDSGITWFEDSDGIAQQRFEKVVYSPNFPTDDTFYVITEDGLLYKTGNAGQSLTRISIPHNVDPAFEEFDVYDVALSPTYNAVLGLPGDTSNETLTLYIAASGGVYMSRNGGFSWNPLSDRNPLAGELGARIIRLSPLFDQDETLVTANDNYLRRSVNDGQDWERVEPGVPIEGFVDFEFSPAYNTGDTTAIVSIIYTPGTSQYPDGGHSFIARDFRDSPPTWVPLIYGDGFNILGDIQFSNGYVDDGTSVGLDHTFWVGQYFTADNADRFTIRPPGILSPNFTNFTWSLRTSGAPMQVDYSDDAAGSWNVLSTDSLLSGAQMLGGPFLSPDYDRGAGVVIFAMEGHLLVSDDGGQSYWVVMGGDSISEDVRAVDTDPNNPLIIFAATGDRGLFKSLDKGLSFHQLLNGLPSVNQEFEDIRAWDSNVILAAHAVDGAYRSADAGFTWNQMADTTGHIMEFAIGGSEIWAARSDGRSVKSADTGLNWVELDPAIIDMVDISYRGDVKVINGLVSVENSPLTTKFGNPNLAVVNGGNGPDPFGIQSPTWGCSKTAGPVATEDGGVTFQSASGSGGPFPLPTGVDFLSVLALQEDNLQVLVGTKGQGVWKTWDGGDTWHRMTKGLESTSQDMAELYQTSTGDILIGIDGATDGGVYLSADGGERWMVINEGFDPDELSVQDLVNDSSEDGTISYWAGKGADGIWTRTIDILPDPDATSLDVGTGSTLGGTAIAVTGTNFQDGAVVYFDGLPAQTLFTSDVRLDIIAPAHWRGAAKVVVINPDTRTDKSPLTFTYTNPAALINLSVGSEGNNVVLTWTDENAKGIYEVFWSSDPTFADGWVEHAATGVVTPRWDHIGAMADNFVYFYKVE